MTPPARPIRTPALRKDVLMRSLYRALVCVMSVGGQMKILPTTLDLKSRMNSSEASIQRYGLINHETTSLLSFSLLSFSMAVHLQTSPASWGSA